MDYYYQNQGQNNQINFNEQTETSENYIEAAQNFEPQLSRNNNMKTIFPRQDDFYMQNNDQSNLPIETHTSHPFNLLSSNTIANRFANSRRSLQPISSPENFERDTQYIYYSNNIIRNNNLDVNRQSSPSIQVENGFAEVLPKTRFNKQDLIEQENPNYNFSNLKSNSNNNIVFNESSHQQHQNNQFCNNPGSLASLVSINEEAYMNCNPGQISTDCVNYNISPTSNMSLQTQQQINDLQNSRKQKSRGRRVFNKTECLNSNNNSMLNGRNFVCEYKDCNKLFKRSEHLKRHIRSIHTQDRPFQCYHQTCQKRFSRSDNLNQHLKTHKHGKRYVDEKWSSNIHLNNNQTPIAEHTNNMFSIRHNEQHPYCQNYDL